MFALTQMRASKSVRNLRTRNILTLAAAGTTAALLLTGCGAQGSGSGSEASGSAASQGAGQENVPEGWHYVAGGEVPSAKAEPKLPVKVKDGTCETVEVKDASKIIAASDGVVSILDSLGLSDKVYAAPQNSVTPTAKNAPEHFEYSQKTGVEGLLSVKGTMFIGDNVDRHGQVAKKFREAGVSAAVYSDQEETTKKITDVGSYVGADAAAKEVSQKVGDQLKEAATYKDKLKGKKILQVTSNGAGGANAVVGSGTAGADIVKAIGATSVGEQAGLRGYSVKFSKEGLLDAKPDVIVMGTGDVEEWGGAEGFLQAFPTLADTPAAKNNQIYVMPSEQISVSGPAIGAGALALGKALADGSN
ncbi:ABC transporter substrate-binding protein [Brevibacterium sp. 91QC2O2]|uniref:ABC transporter substrate-binding protein n=1 Tax=Brevibacterium sp. 91QC2O2 TaxID=2968458 RepID=UPI00211CC7E2|nr:ABC transporter substrate-binding protein [Brevibacterium sp. 91QC2O2]MCQ9367687.1 ABC transporter substrate-binding protein [Brevibacterium sp. 91QC2O2]